MTRLTFESVSDTAPVWSADSSRVAFRSNRDGLGDLYQQTAGGSGRDELLLKSPENKQPSQWSFDGRFIVYTSFSQGDQQRTSNPDLWLLPTFGDRKPLPFLQTKFTELHGQLSPNGRWMAYTSNESGSYQVYVQPFPASGTKWQVSSSGGSHPRWNPNGKEIFYLAGDSKLMAAAVRPAGSRFETDAPRVLFQTQVPPAAAAGSLVYNVYSVTPDGQRFLVLTTPQDRNTAPITVVVNWMAGLNK